MVLAGLLEKFKKPELSIFIFCVILGTAAWAKFLLPPLGLYLSDYLSRLIIIVVVLSACGAGAFFERVRSPVLAAVAVASACYLTLLLDQLSLMSISLGPMFVNWLYPAIGDPVLRWGDAVFGVALVALHEELVYRYLPVRIGNNRQWSTRTVYALSVIAFALLHLPRV